VPDSHPVPRQQRSPAAKHGEISLDILSMGNKYLLYIYTYIIIIVIIIINIYIIYIYVQYLYIMGNKDETGAEIIGGFMVKEPLGLDVSPGVFWE
jgi:E3 ubiquitin-protein ligase DOA10